MKWYIGQPIVAIKNHSEGDFKKGNEFTIKGLKSPQCKCGHMLIDIGIPKDYTFTHNECTSCGNFRSYDGYYNEKCFAPLDVDISELTEILTKENQLTNY